MTDSSSAPAVVSVRRDGDVAIIDLDDGKANALGHETIAALLASLDQVEADGADAVVLAGRPGRFSAGFELKAGVNLFLRLYLFPRPVVAACTGHAIAAGAILLLSSDVRVGAAGEFKVGLPEVTIGMPLPFFATEMARDRISKRHYAQVILGRMTDPAAAVDVGFLDEVVDPDDVVEVALDRARALTGVSRGGLVRTRVTSRGAVAEAIRAGLEDDLAHFNVEG